ncbi:MAG: phytanoyl-CoA dioxygenase family protein [Pedobacter sp.]|uniref:phytanoyl-CoA dioxygenase family protein n=1 Tax=Pedobacter sp. TaxID=1411316 RepID=UPI003568B9EC
MTECNFSKLVFQVHQNRKLRIPTDVPADFDYLENVWLSFYGLGKFEFYSFLYSECKDFEHFKEWVIKLKGTQFVHAADQQFKKWEATRNNLDINGGIVPKVLNADQMKFWEQNGYLVVPKVVDDLKCDKVRQKICRYLNIHLDFPATWYMSHPDWQGIMVQLYQNEDMEAIRQDLEIRKIFADLYNSDQIIPNTEKVGYNPPEVEGWEFKHGELHWDLDLSKTVQFGVQALVYLDDVPVERGALQVVPGFNNKFEDWIKDFTSLERAHTYMRLTETSVPVPGEKGDLILWRNTIPHAAGKNQSNLPRFVQYVSFTKV